jgi:membrane protease YdiL (CAAX protease family)
VTARGLWLRAGIGTALALVLLVAVTPARPARRLPLPLALAVGVVAGAGLYAVAVRAPLGGATRSASLAVAAARHAFFGLLATDEEILWRRVTLGLLLPRGVALALIVSALTFAFAHRRRVGLQLVTGSVFGVVYLGTGLLAASVGAHWIYNELVARARPAAPT